MAKLFLASVVQLKGLLDSSQANTYRLHQAITASKYLYPRAVGTDVMWLHVVR